MSLDSWRVIGQSPLAVVDRRRARAGALGLLGDSRPARAAPDRRVRPRPWPVSGPPAGRGVTFWSAVRCWNRLNCWNTMPTSWRTASRSLDFVGEQPTVDPHRPGRWDLEAVHASQHACSSRTRGSDDHDDAAPGDTQVHAVDGPHLAPIEDLDQPFDDHDLGPRARPGFGSRVIVEPQVFGYARSSSERTKVIER